MALNHQFSAVQNINRLNKLPFIHFVTFFLLFVTKLFFNKGDNQNNLGHLYAFLKIGTNAWGNIVIDPYCQLLRVWVLGKFAPHPLTPIISVQAARSSAYETLQTSWTNPEGERNS